MAKGLFKARQLAERGRVGVSEGGKVVVTNANVFRPRVMGNGPRREGGIRPVGGNPAAESDGPMVGETLNPFKGGAEPLVSKLGGRGDGWSRLYQSWRR